MNIANYLHISKTTCPNFTKFSVCVSVVIPMAWPSSGGVVICLVTNGRCSLDHTSTMHCVREASSDCKNAEMERDRKRSRRQRKKRRWDGGEGKQMLASVLKKYTTANPERPKAEASKAKSGSTVGEGQLAPSPPATGYGEQRKLSQRGPGSAQAVKKFSCIIEAPYGLPRSKFD